MSMLEDKLHQTESHCCHDLVHRFGGVLTPNVGRYVPRQTSQRGQVAPERAPVRAWKWGLQDELVPFWACKWGAPERAWSALAWKWDCPKLARRVWLTRSAENRTLRITARTRLANPRRCVRAEPAVGGNERVEIKEILKPWWSPERQNPLKKCKMLK